MNDVSNALRGTAFHEAGNAVVAQYFGLKVVELAIRQDGSGRTDTVGTTDDLPLIDRVAIHCAGQASRTVFKYRSHALGGSEEVGKLLEGLADEHRLEIANAGYRRAIEIVKSNAPAVERLAICLIEQRRVDGDTLT
jgi:hypothetical protein